MFFFLFSHYFHYVNDQLSVLSLHKNRQVVLLDILHISTFFIFFKVLLNKSDCFRTVELHIVQLIAILFDLTKLILYYFSYCNIDQIGQNIFLHVLSSFSRTRVKTLIVKFRLLPRKTSISHILLPCFY